MAWASDVDTGIAWTRDDMLGHHAVVTLVDNAANGCLPARFGTELVVTLLREKQDELREALDRVHGRAELAVTVLSGRGHEARSVDPSAEESTPSGTVYLRARAARLAAARDLAERVETIAGADLAASEHRLAPSDGVLLSSALLIERAVANTVKARLYREARDVRILVNGPWPAYTFAALGARVREA